MGGRMPARILCVEDDAISREVISAYLKQQGHTVRALENGYGVSKHVREFKPDVLVIDVMMPGLDGEATLAVLRSMARSYSLPIPRIILYSGVDAGELQARADRVGASAAVSKRDGVMALAQAVTQALDPEPAAVEG